MRFDGHVGLSAMGLALMAPACAGTVDVAGGAGRGAGGGAASDTAGSSTPNASTSAVGAGGGGGSSTSVAGAGGSAGGAPDFCTGACAKPDDAGCFATPTCTAYCDARAGVWPDEVRAVFATCVAQDPLCFLSVEGCMLGRLYPPATPKTIRLSGTGFSVNDGSVVHVWHDPGAAPPFGGQVTVTSGAFAFEWHEPVALGDTSGPLLLLYVDVDGNGTCDAADLTVAATTEWNGDFIAPLFEAALTPPLATAAFVCSATP